MIYWAGFIVTKAKSLKNRLSGGIGFEPEKVSQDQGTQTENKWGRIFQGGLIVIVFLLVIQVWQGNHRHSPAFHAYGRSLGDEKHALSHTREAWAFAFCSAPWQCDTRNRGLCEGAAHPATLPE
jgi:hypothetical protein